MIRQHTSIPFFTVLTLLSEANFYYGPKTFRMLHVCYEVHFHSFTPWTVQLQDSYHLFLHAKEDVFVLFCFGKFLC